MFRRIIKLSPWVILPLLLLGFAVQASILQAPSSGSWAPVPGTMAEATSGAASALLPDGRILITGGAGPSASAEFFNLDGSFSLAPSMAFPRQGHTAVTLQDGRVLVSGGTTAGPAVTDTAEIYDPATNAWTTTGLLMVPRSGHTATLLQDGRVLIAGGENSGGATASVEVFNPVSGTSSLTAGVLSSARVKHAAAALPDGRVLIAGGSDGTSSLASMDVFDPLTDFVAPGPALGAPRQGLSASTLLDGTVLIAGGSTSAPDGSSQDLASAEIFNSSIGTFTAASSSLATARSGHLAILLPHNNSVLIVGGNSAGSAVASAELYRPWSGQFTATGSMASARASATGASPLEGVLVVAGGCSAGVPTGGTSCDTPLASAEAYGFATIKTDKDDYAPGEIVTITGSGWQPGETVSLLLHESNNPTPHEDRTLTALADDAGNILDNSFSPESHDLGVRFYLTATGANSQAQMTFTDANNPTIAVTLSGTGSGTVTSADGFISCTLTLGVQSGTCSHLYSGNASTTLTASAAGGSTFGGWGGGGCTGTGTCAASASGNSTTTVPGTFTLNQAPAITSANNTSFTVGAPGSFTVTATGVPAPTFSESGALPSGVTFSTSTHILSGTPALGTVGSYPISFTVSNGVLPNATQNFTLTVGQASTTTTITAPNTNPATPLGAAYTVSWTVTVNAPSSGTPTGTVNVTNGTDSCSAAVGAGSCLLPSTIPGNPLTITATYSGDANFVGSSDTQTHNIDVATQTGVVSSVNPSKFGQSVTFTATVLTSFNSASVTEGCVTFIDNSNGGATLSGPTVVNGSGQAGFSTSSLSVGTHDIQANYNDQGGCAGATGIYSNSHGNVSQVVQQADTTTTITSDTPDPSDVGDPVPIHFTVVANAPGAGTPTGNVTLTVNDLSGDNCTGTVAAGSCNLTFTTSGSKTLTATYAGDTNFAGSTSAGEPHTVNNPDSDPPIVTIDAGTPDGSNSWFVHSPVSVAITADDTTTGNSNVSAITCLVDGLAASVSAGPTGIGTPTASETISVSGEGTHSISCTATDSASNTGASAGSTTMPVEVKIDTVKPANVSVSADRVADHGGWYNHAFTATWTGDDAISGIASCTVTNYSTPDTASGSISGTCTDNAGNVSDSVNFTFKYDATAPTSVSGAPNRSPDHNTWYNHSVDIVFTGSDATSGIDTCTTVTYTTPDGASRTVNGTCTDKAGNTSAPVASSAFNYDSTPPNITITTPANGASYTLNAMVASNYGCTDATSGVHTCTGPVANGANFSTSPVGLHHFKVDAYDQAGNHAVATNDYNVNFAVCVLYDQTKVWKSGSTVPVKLQLCDANGVNYSSSSIIVTANLLVPSGFVGDQTPDDSGNANPDSNFRFDGGMYIFNLSTKGLLPDLAWALHFTASGDPGDHTVNFGIR